MPDSSRERVLEFHKRQRERGLQLVRVWVPVADAQRIREVAQELRANAGLTLPEDNNPPHPGWAFVGAGQGEKELHALLRANRARWDGEAEAWRIRADLVAKLGLEDRLVQPKQAGAQRPANSTDGAAGST